MNVEHPDQGVKYVDSPLSTRIHILWLVKLSLLYRKLSLNTVAREICGYIGDMQKLISVLKREVQCFDVATSEWQKFCALRRNVNVSGATSSTFITPTTIFLCGGGACAPCTCYVVYDAYMLTADGSAQELPHMIAERLYPGVVWDSGRKALYVFGGTVGTTFLRSSEMFLSNEWRRLPDMHQRRSMFNPCWHSCLVYLCGGGDTNSVETYDPWSNTFVLQHFILPERGPTTAVVDHGVLTVISWNHIFKLQQRTLASQWHEVYYPWSSCTPVVREGAVYVCFNNTCSCIDLTTGEQRKVGN